MSRKAKILVIGDVMLDHYVYGSVDRMSPEAPVPVLDVEKEEGFPGGAGIVASALAALGADVSFLSVVGDDAAARDVEKLLAKQGVSASLEKESGRKTTVKTRFVDHSLKVDAETGLRRHGFTMLLRADNETHQGIRPGTETALFAALEIEAAELRGARGRKVFDIIIVSDYAKGLLTKSLITRVLAFARTKKKKVVVDTKGDISAYKGDNVILVPNLHELGAASSVKEMKNDDDEVRNCALALSKSSGSVVVVKRSGKGASIAEAAFKAAGTAKTTGTGSFRTYPSLIKPEEVVNVSGAGDIFVAIFTLALASGKSMDEAVKLANAGCAKAIAKQHPSITKAELPGLTAATGAAQDG